MDAVMPYVASSRDRYPTFDCDIQILDAAKLSRSTMTVDSSLESSAALPISEALGVPRGGWIDEWLANEETYDEVVRHFTEGIVVGQDWREVVEALDPTESSTPTSSPGQVRQAVTESTLWSESAGGSACGWLSSSTVAIALPNGTVTKREPVPLEPDAWLCSWRGTDSEFRVRFDRFAPGFRSVEAELLRIGGDGADNLVTVAGHRGVFRRPGVWYGETPLDQYGMFEIHLTHDDGSSPDQAQFTDLVMAVINDLIAANPEVPQ